MRRDSNTKTKQRTLLEYNLVIALIITTTLILTSCSGNRYNPWSNPTKTNYFVGYDGVRVQFENLQRNMYYTSSNPNSIANNFDFSVKIENRGSSYTRGAVFISGYSPNLIKIDQIPIGKQSTNACSLRLNSYSLNRFGAIFQCEGFSVSGHQVDGSKFNLDSINLKGSKLFGDKSLLSQINIDYTRSEQGLGDVEISWNGIDFSYLEHGQLLIALLAGINFERVLGQEFLLAGNTYETPGGEIEYKDYNGHIVNWPQGLDKTHQKFMLTACYLYTTYLAQNICIDPQPYSETPKVCRPITYQGTKGQGAPVAITSIEQENTPTKAVLRFTIANKGRGTVYEPGMIEKCSPYNIERTSPSDLNIVWIGEVRVGNTRLDCTPEHMVKIDPRTGRGTFTCTYNLEYAQLKSAYWDTVTVELWYGYSTSTSQDVEIKRVD